MEKFLLFQFQQKRLMCSLVAIMFIKILSASIGSNVYDNLHLRPDTITKQQVVYKAPGDSGKEQVWDFSMLDILDDDYQVYYFIPEHVVQDTLCGMENRMRYYYRYDGDTLATIGYENPTIYVAYSRPEYNHCLSMQFGDTLISRFRGKGVYGTDMSLKFGGKTTIIYDAEGTIKLPDGTYENVLRSYAYRRYHESGFDSTKMWQETYRWYMKGCPYPIFESVSAFAEYKNDTLNLIDTVERTSFYYVIPEDTRTKYEALSRKDSLANPVDAIWAKASFNPNPVYDDLTIRYTLKRAANIGYSIHTTSGMVMNRIPSVPMEEGEHTKTLSLGGYPASNYTLYIYVDYYVIKQVIIKL